MNANQMHDLLEGKGFDVKLDGMSFIVSLKNRKPDAMMLELEINDNAWKVEHHGRKSVIVSAR